MSGCARARWRRGACARKRQAGTEEQAGSHLRPPFMDALARQCAGSACGCTHASTQSRGRPASWQDKGPSAGDAARAGTLALAAHEHKEGVA